MRKKEYNPWANIKLNALKVALEKALEHKSISRKTYEEIKALLKLYI